MRGDETTDTQKAARTDTGRFLRERMKLQPVSIRDLATRVGCDERTIQRAYNGLTVPKSQIADRIARELDSDVNDLWPSSATRRTLEAPTVPVRVFASRAQVPIGIWRDAFSSAIERIDVCVYGGTFLFDTVPGFGGMLRDAASRGVHLRFVVGDPGSAAVHQRGAEEEIGGDALSGRCRMTLARLEPLHVLENVEVRTQHTTLYASLFFTDDVLFANHHILGSPASDNPVIELLRDADVELWERYRQSFEAIWDASSPARYPLSH